MEEKAQPKSVLDRERLAQERREKALQKAQRDTADERHATGWYQYFKQEDVDLLETQEIAIHPTPLLSIADHYMRAAQGTNRRVVGCLLGETDSGKTHVTNSFGVPFEEHAKDTTIWYLDHSYLDKMFRMFKKINARENVVGWYSSAGVIKPNDHMIHELFRQYCRHPLFLVVDVAAKCKEENAKPLVQTYYSFEQPSHDNQNRRTFVHTNFTLGASEAEEVGVEHLLRDVESNYEVTLGTAIEDKVNALSTAAKKLEQISVYLKDVAEGRREVKPHILAQLQVLMNSLPEKSDPDVLAQGFQRYTNDALLASYIGTPRCSLAPPPDPFPLSVEPSAPFPPPSLVGRAISGVVGFATKLVMMIHELTLNKKKMKEKQQLDSPPANAVSEAPILP
ncbi:putative 26S proteasome regulatory subunit [Gregarina niphandrodes]|uniref:26S proteasome regulatory subunit n=1 Tax=Gregarina niphandrodes TaxID=110365 RepID=A0A023B9P6_GRENI|nr:putative 26S proteasome regulatory subunit [Gregarina niphandrodes]EZG73070.1 putative 26S proteasome regulatory subunit [Gregarina niphandrodes]|eukprot:XP_011129662.1 putative 26S proteasome regulatory subunit [Gregarina niphandrodes]